MFALKGRGYKSHHLNCVVGVYYYTETLQDWVGGLKPRLRFAKGVSGWEPGALFCWLCLEILAEITYSLITHRKHLQVPGDFYSFKFAASGVYVTLGNHNSWPLSWIHVFKNRDGTEERIINRLHFKGLPKANLRAAKYYIRLSEKWLNEIVFQGLVLEK